MRYLLDTDSLTEFYEPASSGYLSITDRVASLPSRDLVFASILSLYELEYGYANATDDLNPSSENGFPRLKKTSHSCHFYPKPLGSSGALRLDYGYIAN